MAKDLEIVDGEAAGSWIGAGLTGATGSVTGAVPDSYKAYVRILHPASLGGEWVTWGRVADELGRVVHPLAQWDAIVGADRYRNETPDWPGSEPETGSLEQHLLRPLLKILAQHTTAGATVAFDRRPVLRIPRRAGRAAESQASAKGLRRPDGKSRRRATRRGLALSVIAEPDLARGPGLVPCKRDRL